MEILLLYSQSIQKGANSLVENMLVNAEQTDSKTSLVNAPNSLFERDRDARISVGLLAVGNTVLMPKAYIAALELVMQISSGKKNDSYDNGALHFGGFLNNQDRSGGVLAASYGRLIVEADAELSLPIKRHFPELVADPDLLDGIEASPVYSPRGNELRDYLIMATLWRMSIEAANHDENFYGEAGEQSLRSFRALGIPYEQLSPVKKIVEGDVEYEAAAIRLPATATAKALEDHLEYRGEVDTQVFFAAPAEVSKKLSVQLLSDKQQIDKAFALEKTTWEKNRYGSLEEYEKYSNQSRVFGVFDGEKCLGVTRMISGGPEVPPFMSEMTIDDPAIKAELALGCEKGIVEELGTTAVADDAPIIKTSMDMWRIAYRDAVSRNIQTWGIIMEPDRVKAMTKRYGFPFHQIGPEIDYQGGLCAAHIMPFEEVHTYMRTERPDYYRWFVKEAI